ncbi:solute carrier family 46 member 3-like [Daktulosphaira vitifoliae]|uniref:solute carrier family 46 member 3-like n=1 Tax=Daktulosphaira vitifoliae TaxID=58002 RepID=UPI0021AAB260|nr:solute carrier family 46 member 3-like [Daktulosphaira vitifoliae]XP_050538922.1 solute carrier family 46 member 3-like [Daktulosphaira vitifoliae]XP_050538923.1 solute carrier family 46 member 3-like [Daktulosphaira vitifoliae]XP_050538924.1 solute carrier family 46 member 3-like [Daktulosphaira vitifoliae]XP_050538925.1 solute carrier family 46 member 3-like [Daktulosphaira vitifoliae]
MCFDVSVTKCEKQENIENQQMDDQDEWKSLSVTSKAKFLFKHCTVEPMLGCYIVSSVLTSLATQNLNLQKACRVNLRLNESICYALENKNTVNFAKEELMVQELVADMIIWKTIMQSSIPSILITFVGSWSDRNHKRKPCMLVPIIGEFLTSIGLLVCTYYFYELPMEVAGLVESIPPAMTGGWMTMFMAVFSYVGDVSSVKMRTLRIGVVNVFCFVGIPVGTALSGVLFKKLGFYGVYTIATVLYILSFTYGLFFIKEKKPEVHIDDNKQPAEISCIYLVKDFFNVGHIKEAIRIVFKGGQHNRRLRIILLMVVVIVANGPIYGEMSVMYLFTRVRFNWDEVDYSLFSTYSMITNSVGTIFSVGVFSHMLQIDDAVIGVMSCMSKILAGFVYAYATTDFIYYLGALVDILNGTSIIAMRSIVSKLVPPHELGKANSLFGVCEALVPLIYGPMYSAVYKTTLKSFPGAFFLLGGALTIPAVIIFLWMYNEHKKEKIEKGKEFKEGNYVGDVKEKKYSDIRSPAYDSVLKTVVDTITQIDSFELDNMTFQDDVIREKEK